jgi:glucose/arabinose dehydrogenase
MKLGKVIACLMLAGCGAAPSAPATSVTNNSASVPAAEGPSQPATAAQPEAAKPAAPTATADQQAAADDAPELPKIVFTPPSELRTNTRAKLESALKSTKGQTTANGVASILTRSLGKPTWIENDSKRVWVANDATQCVRIVLHEDGSTDLEKMRTTESKNLARSVRQNLCTGQIEKDE